MSISAFLDKHFRHFNAREMVAAARSYKTHIADGGSMLLTMAGAMSTAEIGVSLARMIRAGKVHAISCTAANLEEDVFNLLSHNDYELTPDYLSLSPDEETALRERGMNRVTDTCIPETCVRFVERWIIPYCVEAAEKGESYFPYEYLFRMLDEPEIEKEFQIPREDSWLIAAKEAGIPIFSPGFEDSTLGNIFAARCLEGKIKSHHAMRSGTEQMAKLVTWYEQTSNKSPVGFFQIAGGIAGDFAICAVPLMIQDMELDVPYWAYFCQISDSTMSYGSYSGAAPNEKITWGKLNKETPKFMINSDASIVAPLMFAYILGE
ncbi:deoxyhypusine synthase family protein [Lignipirellula cremea]|uniref:Deoxyhypusine synthase-like protein n=1 Tax=Lignipirellula cremea TaxID=2528010 RepID=A0A518DPN6_9BACT|nr:deoxyhypusine synthase family protein [Lignipirellula cremea]QDU93789.1 deoxyhypusine synthase-like protein [Lignipirellula cremea]